MTAAYQLSLDLPALDDRSAKLVGQPKFPETRAECIGEASARRAGAVDCPHVRCRYHLLGELARRPEAEAEEAMLARLEGRWRDSCALDIADTLQRDDRGMSEQDIATILGVSRDRVIQLSAEAASRLRAKMLPILNGGRG